MLLWFQSIRTQHLVVPDGLFKNFNVHNLLIYTLADSFFSIPIIIKRGKDLSLPPLLIKA
jgi:hypothetical protein